jgi:FG-GAP repeat
MIRIVSRPSAIAAIFAGILWASAFAQTPVWANDTSEEGTSLTVVADLNGDGIVDIATANPPAGNSGG